MESATQEHIPWDLEFLKAYFAPSCNWNDDSVGLCKRCEPTVIGGTTLKITADDDLERILERYSSSYCPFCRVFWSALAQFTNSVSQIKHFWFLFDHENASLALLKWNGTTNSGKANTIGNTIELYSTLDMGFIAARPMIPFDLESQQYWTSWRERLECCITEHENCSSSAQGYMPTRLLDLSPQSGPVLVNGNTTNGPKPYAALSYCWGGASFIKTTDLNIESHQCGIPTSSLPPLFKDIVQITLKLGLRYLWIDSLCIIQGSKSDWEIESAQMGQIFAQSFVVLAAGAPESPLGGLVLQRAESIVVDIMDIPDSEAMPIYAREPLEHPVWSCLEYLQKDSSIYLQRRGWCYQEYWLASRVLTLLPWETMYKCNEQIHCECGDPWNGNHDDNEIVRSWRELTTGRMSSDWKSLARFWEKLVQQFTSLSLTQYADKLPAFSGVAAAFQRESCGRYLAGLWESSLPGALFWTGVDLVDRRPFPRKSVKRHAPSWSWASVEGGVVFYDTKLTYKAGTILECDAAPSGKNPYGEVAEGFIKMRVPVVPLVKFKELCKALETKVQEEQIVSEILDDEYHQEYDDLSNLTSWAKPENPPWAFDSQEDVNADAKSELFCAGFSCYDAEEQCQVWQTMILRKRGDSGMTYRRAGVLLPCLKEPWTPVCPELYRGVDPSIIYLT